MKKFRPPLKDFELKELERLNNLDFTGYSETDVREEFLVELVKLLGYRRELDYSVSREDQFTLNPLFLSIGSSRIKLDYLCSLRKKFFWIIEAKSGKSKSLEKDDIGQAHFYSVHPEINSRYFIVSNGWLTNLYNRDTLDDNCTPLLSIKNTELTNRFLELDSYVGSTQILPFLKTNILEQIEKTLSAEIRVERLPEFVDEVKKTVAKIRPIVEQQSFKFNDREGNPLLSVASTEPLPDIVQTVFQNTRSRIELSGVSHAIIKRLLDNRTNRTFSEYQFFDKLLLQSRPYPVTFWYFHSVMYFLLTLDKTKPFDQLHYGQKTPKVILDEWVDLCLFHLSARPEFRYTWIMEGLYGRLAKKTVLFFPQLREKISQIVDKALFHFDEEQIAFLGPSEAGELIRFVQSFVSINISLFFNKYFDESRFTFKQTLAHQEYVRVNLACTTMEKTVSTDYEKIKKELGSEWSELYFFDSMNLTYDPMGSAVCDLLQDFPEYVKGMPEKNKLRIKLLAELGLTNYAEELCKILNIEIDKSNPAITEKRKLLFEPDADQYNL